MGNLPNKKFTEEEIYRILNYYKISKGGEAVVCEGPTDFSVYKIFTENMMIAPMSENKEKKIELLHQLDLDHSNKVLSTISCNGELVGYEASTSPYLQAYKAHELYLDDEELLYYLKRTRDVLEYFKSKGVIYADFDTRNVLFDRHTGEIMFCDMDNVEVGGYKIDLLPWDLHEYSETRGIDYGVHPYMHNILLLRLINEDIYTMSAFLNRFKHFRRGAYPILNTMLYPEDFNDKYLVDYVKRLNR